LQPVSRNNSVFHHLNLSGNYSKKDVDLSERKSRKFQNPRDAKKYLLDLIQPD
jgi:hypothetical protein